MLPRGSRPKWAVRTGQRSPTQRLWYLVPIAIHRQQAQQVEGMAALGEAAHSHGPEAPAGSHITVPGRHRQLLHADDAVLQGRHTAHACPCMPTTAFTCHYWATVCQCRGEGGALALSEGNARPSKSSQSLFQSRGPQSHLSSMS